MMYQKFVFQLSIVEQSCVSKQQDWKLLYCNNSIELFLNHGDNRGS